MPADAAQAQTYNVARVLSSGQAPVPAGKISIDATHHIHIIASEPHSAGRLEMAAGELNLRDSFNIRTAPPEDAQPMSLWKRQVMRTDADAGEAIREILIKDFGLILEPAS
jgi:hypothetical protein